MPEGQRNTKEKAIDIALGAIKYVVWVGVVVGSLAAVFYTSQATQDDRTSTACQRITAVETDVQTLHRADERATRVIEATKQDLAKTREEMTKLAATQESMAREQRTLSEGQQKLDDKLDDLKTILIRIENRNP